MKGCASIVVILCLYIISSTSGKKTTPHTKTTSGHKATTTAKTTITTSMTTMTPTTAKTTITTSMTTTTPMTTTAAPIYCESQYSCVDCTTARMCAPSGSGHLREIGRFKCPTDYWCDPSSGTCTPEAPESCDPPVEGLNYTCMHEGYFPVPDNCNKYYVCESPDYVPYVHKCPVNVPFYIPFYQACMGSCYESYCFNSSSPCTGYNGVKVAVPYTNNMFTYCEDEMPMLVDRCFGAYEFNSTSQTCEPACPHEGLFPSDADCTKYYRCSPDTPSPSETRFVMTLDLTCPPGQAFLEKDYECVDSSLVLNCNTSALGLSN